MSSLVKRSFSLAGHRTSVALEPEFWAVLNKLASRRGVPLASFVATLDSERPADRPLASVLRVHALLADRADR